jgi:hypothetical protein
LTFKDRIPKSGEIMLVFAVNVVILYSFSLWFSFQDFSKNWILYLDIADILGLFAYVIIGAFLESLFMTAFLIFICLLIPSSITRDRFVAYGTILTITLLTALIVRDGSYVGISALMRNNDLAYTVLTIGTLVLALAVEYIKKARSAMEALADRCLIFLYLYMPLTAAAMIIVVMRNLS